MDPIKRTPPGSKLYGVGPYSIIEYEPAGSIFYREYIWTQGPYSMGSIFYMTPGWQDHHSTDTDPNWPQQ